jgi:hypothetical protein
MSTSRKVVELLYRVLAQYEERLGVMLKVADHEMGRWTLDNADEGHAVDNNVVVGRKGGQIRNNTSKLRLDVVTTGLVLGMSVN